jgi:hypothetical protein
MKIPYKLFLRTVACTQTVVCAAAPKQLLALCALLAAASASSPPLELLGLRQLRLSEPEARRLVGACSGAEGAVPGLIGRPTVVLALRGTDARKRLKALPAEGLLCSKAPRTTLSLLAAFFPASAVTADGSYPASRWLASIPSAAGHPFLAFFPQAVHQSTVCVLSPRLHLAKGNAIVRVLKRIEKEDLLLRRLALRTLSATQWACLPDAPAQPPAGACVVFELTGKLAVGKWADAVGPLTGGDELGTRSLRGVVRATLPPDDLGVFTAQNVAHAAQLQLLLSDAAFSAGGRDRKLKFQRDRSSLTETTCLVCGHELLEQVRGRSCITLVRGSPILPKDGALGSGGLDSRGRIHNRQPHGRSLQSGRRADV